MSAEKSTSSKEGVAHTDSDTECVEYELGPPTRTKKLTKSKSSTLPPKTEQESVLDSLCSLVTKLLKLSLSKSSTSSQ